jgi:hypothetical protein
MNAERGILRLVRNAGCWEISLPRELDPSVEVQPSERTSDLDNF